MQPEWVLQLEHVLAVCWTIQGTRLSEDLQEEVCWTGQVLMEQQQELSWSLCLMTADLPQWQQVVLQCWRLMALQYQQAWILAVRQWPGCPQESV